MNTKNDTSVQRLVAASLLAAITFLSTTIFKFPTPVFGYIHIGDGAVLLCGYLLGPVAGGLAAGIGSFLSDLLGGYIVFAPGTFVIKFVTAMSASFILRLLTGRGQRQTKHLHLVHLYLVLSGLVGEVLMVTGYFFYNIFILTVINPGGAEVTFYSALTESFAEIPFNAVQGAVGIMISTVLLPMLYIFSPVRSIAVPVHRGSKKNIT